MTGKRIILAILIIVLLCLVSFIFADPVQSYHQTTSEVTLTVVGRVVNTQGSAVEAAEVQIVSEEDPSRTLAASLGAVKALIV